MAEGRAAVHVELQASCESWRRRWLPAGGATSSPAAPPSRLHVALLQSAHQGTSVDHCRPLLLVSCGLSVARQRDRLRLALRSRPGQRATPAQGAAAAGQVGDGCLARDDSQASQDDASWSWRRRWSWQLYSAAECRRCRDSRCWRPRSRVLQVPLKLLHLCLVVPDGEVGLGGTALLQDEGAIVLPGRPVLRLKHAKGHLAAQGGGAPGMRRCNACLAGRRRQSVPMSCRQSVAGPYAEQHPRLVRSLPCAAHPGAPPAPLPHVLAAAEGADARLPAPAAAADAAEAGLASREGGGAAAHVGNHLVL